MLHSGCFICQNFDYLMMTESVNDNFTSVSRCSDKNFIYHVQELLIQILCGLIFDNLLPGQLSLRFVMSEKIKHFHKFHFWDVSFFQQMLVWLPKFQKKETSTGKQGPQNPPHIEDIFLPMHIFIWDVDDVLANDLLIQVGDSSFYLHKVHTIPLFSIKVEESISLFVTNVNLTSSPWNICQKY